ncbi:MAG: transglutaminase domain-containing protein, partial [Cyanobacteria bacterium]|nr:transglutaminase domain-containing protein [Cyanobacteriota bacterium]
MTSGGDAQKDYDKSLDQLQKVTRDGHQTSYWWLMAGGVGYLVKRFAPGGTADQFQDRQRDALNDWRSAQETLAKSMMENNILTDCLKELDSMKVASSYVKALGDGEVRDSDMHALDLLRRCGAEGLHKQFPFIYKGIFGDDLDPKLLGRTVALEAKSGEIWQRLKRMHVTETDAPPRFRTTGDALNYLVRADLCRSQGPSSDSLYLQRKDVHDAAVSEAFRHVDQDERMAAALSTYGKLAGLMGTTQMLFHEGMAGERGSHYTNFARRMADQMQETLEELRREAPAIRQLIKELEQAREKAVDVDAKEGLNARIKILDDILTGFVPNSQGQTNSRKYNELQEMCRVMRSTDFDPNTFGTWLRDNAVSLALVTTALAGIATMPFSGGASGVLATIAISALTATTCYVASEAWKFGMHKWGGAAYGSDFVDCVLELAGVKTRDTNTLKYEGGKFVVPKQMDEVFADALKEIGKETLLFVGAAGFGKLVGETLKHCSNPAAKMAGTEMIKDVNKLAKALDVAAAKNPLAVRWAKDFMREWVDQIPWAVVAGTTEAILHDSINALDPEGKMGQDREVLEHMAHIAAVGFTVFSHRVAGHVMRPHVLAGGKVEIPYNRADFLFELRKHYTAIGKPVPEILIGEDGTASIKAGKKTLSLVFEDPKAVALQLNRLGIKPDPPVPGEPIAPAEATPGEGQKLRSGEPQKTLVEQLEPETLTRLREMVDKGEISHNDFILLQRAYRLGLLKPAPGESITKFLKERILDTESSIRSAFLEDLSFDLRFLERQLAVQGRAVESGPESPAQPAPEAAGAVTGPAAGGELPGGLVPLTPEAYKAPNSSTPVVYRTAEGPRSGYVVTDSSGKSVFVPEPGTTPAVAGEASWSKVPEGYVKVRTNADGTLYYDPASKKLYSVRTDGGALKACEIRSNVSDIPDSELHWPITHAVVRERRALQVGNVRVSSARNGRSLTVGDSPDCDVVAGQAHRNGSRSAVVWGSEEGFFVQKLPGGERVVIRHSDGSADTVLSSGSTHRLRAGDTLVVGEKSVSCTPTTEPAFLKRPLSQTAGETQRGAKIDFAEKVEVTESLKDGGVYEDTYLTNSKVPRRIVDPNHPVIQKVLRDAQELLAQRGKMTPDEEIMVCARLIHELSTPYDTAVDPLSGTNSRTKNDARLNIRAENLDTDIARPDGSKIIHLGDLVTFKRMVCLDQAMLLKVLLDSRGYKCKVVTGKYGSGGHAWCEVEIGGKQYIYDPRNINSQRQGMPAERATAYEPYKSPSERGKKQTLSGQDATRDAIDELKNGSDFEAAAISASLPEGQITPEL